MASSAIVNLVGNALKYGPAGDTILVTVPEDDGHAIREVHDNGPGIPEAGMAHLFTPWFQGREQRGRRRARRPAGTTACSGWLRTDHVRAAW